MVRRFNSLHKGFTLIEVLLATALLGIMMLLLTGSLRIGADSWEAGEERMAKASRLFIVESFLRRHIASLLPVSGVNKNGEMEPAFRGTANTLSYVAPLPDQLEGGGLYRFKLYVAGQDDNRALRVSIVPYQSDPNQSKTEPKPIDDLAIVEEVRNIAFSYYGPETTGGNAPPPGGPIGKWTDTWSDYQLPTLIRIDIEREGEDPWPTVMIAPRTLMLR
jgi:general secretion pathway protein J